MTDHRQVWAIKVKLTSFNIDGRSTYGVVDGDRIREPDGAFRSRFADLKSVIAATAIDDMVPSLETVSHDIERVTLLPVIPNPDKILCVGSNFRSHIQEMGRVPPTYPVLFARFPGSLVGHGQAIVRPTVSEQFDFEGEMAVVIGRTARHVTQSEAMRYVAGYSCFMDGTVRDWQRHTGQFTAGKNFANSGSFGPYLVSPDEIEDPAALTLTTRVNGTVLQQGLISDLVFDIPKIIEYCSTFTELLPGDVIATGTPGGVGAARRPPVWLKSGDSVQVDIPGVGVLNSPVVNETLSD